MQLKPWIIASWPIIECASDKVPLLAADLLHLGTEVSEECDEYGRLLGRTIWGAENVRIGLAWDWSETVDGVFALSDPMSVISNIGFVDDRGASLSETLSAVQLNRITHTLPWQAEVSTATRGARAAAPWAERRRRSNDLHFKASSMGSLSAMGGL